MKYFVILFGFLILIGFTGIVYAELPPIIITQVELWGPESFHVDNVNACSFGATSLGPWSVGWVELYNTQNKTITISDVVLKSNSWEKGFQPITLELNQYCYIGTQDKFTTRVGPGGSLGNDPPPHKDEITTLKYSEQKTQHAFSTISLTDDYADTRTWQLVDGKWIFNEANIKLVPTKIRLDSPLKQFKSGIPIDKIQCKENLILVQKHDNFPACVTPETVPKIVERGWGISDNWIKISNAKRVLNYELDTGKIISIHAFSEYKNPSLPGETKITSLKIKLDSEQDGVLEIVLSRNLIDAKIGNWDDDFFVLFDGIETEYQETKTDATRTLILHFPAKTEMIEILGYGHYNSELRNNEN